MASCVCVLRVGLPCSGPHLIRSGTRYKLHPVLLGIKHDLLYRVAGSWEAERYEQPPPPPQPQPHPHRQGRRHGALTVRVALARQPPTTSRRARRH